VNLFLSLQRHLQYTYTYHIDTEHECDPKRSAKIQIEEEFIALQLDLEIQTVISILKDPILILF
jgi:hypothetical protein